MKKFVLTLGLVFTLLLNFNYASAIEEFKDVGIAKYAVLEVLDDNTPLRATSSENGQRLTHLPKNTVLFAIKENKNYFKVELSENNYAYINKKHVELQAIIPQKRFKGLKKLDLEETKDKYIVNIVTPETTSFITKENYEGLNFTLFDTHYDPLKMGITRTIKNSQKFEFSDTQATEFNLKYISNTPLFGYSVVKTDKGYNFIIKKAPNLVKKKPLKNLVIVVDPGHGGTEKGACAFKLQEKAINLQIAKKLRSELKKSGAKVYLTRSKDKNVGLYDRTAFAIEKEADILLSIHQNSLANPSNVDKKHGVGTYYYHNQSKPLAEAIQRELLISTGFKDDKVNKASFVLTRPTSQISVLIECGYIIHKEEADKLSNKKFQKIIAKAIVKGCKNYLNTNF